MWSHPAALQRMPSERYGTLPWNVARPFALSTGRKAVPTRLRGSESACTRSFVRRKSSRGDNPKSRLVERKPRVASVSSRCPTSPEEEFQLTKQEFVDQVASKTGLGK